MPRRELTLADKVAILDEIRSQPPNTSNRQLEAITGVPKSTIGRLIHQQDKLLEQWALSKGHRGATQKRKRDGKDPEVEEALVKWLSVVTERGVSVNGPMLKSKSEELAKKLGRSNFKATDGWLSRLKSRHGIKFHKSRGKKDTADASSGTGNWKSTQLPNLLQKFCADDIYNAVETGLLYRATPDGSLRYRHEVLQASEKAMDRVTILCCCNMSGTDKRKLLVIGKCAKPRCFKGLTVDSLPVLYYDNKNAWMTSEIFKDWLMSWDAELRWASRKVLLLLENCAAHPRLDCLENIHVEFLPVKTTPLVSPMDTGIVQNLKALYRGRLVNYILEAIEEKKLTPASEAVEVSAKVNLLRAVQFVADSWREVSGTTIQNCFARYGFQLSGLEMTDCDNEAILEFQHVVNFEEFASVDSCLRCYGENDNFEDEIVEQIAAKHQKMSEDSDEGDGAETPDVDEVANQDARKYIAGLRRYFMQQGNEGSPTSALDVCADFVHLQSIKRTRQGTLEKFLEPS